MLGGALIRTGDFPRAEQALERGAGGGEGRPATAGSSFGRRSTGSSVRAFTKPEVSVEEIVTVADEVIPLLEDLDDDLGLAKAWWLKSEVHVNACRWGERAANLERALEHARKAGDTGEQSTLASFLVQALYYGPTPAGEAITRAESFLADRPDDRSLESVHYGRDRGARRHARRLR